MNKDTYSIPSPLGSITVSEDGCTLNGSSTHARIYQFLVDELPGFVATEEATDRWACTFDLENLGWLMRFAERVVKNAPRHPVSGESEESNNLWYREVVGAKPVRL